MVLTTSLFGADSAPTGVRTEPVPPALQAQSTTLWDRDSLFINELVESSIPDSGFAPFAVWTGEQWSNLGGGLKTGTTWDSLFTLGFEQDLSKIADKGNLGSLGMTFFYYTSSGDFDGEYLNAMSSPSNIFSGDMVRIFEIYYSNAFSGSAGDFNFRVGQLAADEDFMGIDYADTFLNSSFGAIPANAANALYNGANAFSQYSLATLGAVVGYTYDAVEFKVGVYNGNAGEDVSGNHGFDYSLQGVALWYEGAYNYELFGLGGRAALGGNYNSNQFLNYNTGLGERNFYSFYLSVQQDLYVDAEGKPILGGFCRIAWAPNEDIADFAKYIDAGINWFAPIPGRDDDVFALGVSALETGSAVRNADDLSRYQSCLETTYRIQLSNFMSLQPSFQVFFNPPNDQGNDETAFVAGARLEVVF